MINKVYAIFRTPTLPQIKANIAEKLGDVNLSDDEREILLAQHGVLDDMNFDAKGNLTIFRAMWVTPLWIKNARPGSNIGIYWSHDPNTASPYNASTMVQDVDFLIEAIIAPRYIFWDTIWYFHKQGENEVRLETNDIVRVSRIWINQKPVTLSNWIRRSYRA